MYEQRDTQKALSVMNCSAVCLHFYSDVLLVQPHMTSFHERLWHFDSHVSMELWPVDTGGDVSNETELRLHFWCCEF